MRKVLILLAIIMITVSIFANDRAVPVAPNNLTASLVNDRIPIEHVKLDWFHGVYEDFATGAENFIHSDNRTTVNNGALQMQTSGTVGNFTWLTSYYDRVFSDFVMEVAVKRTESTATLSKSMSIIVRGNGFMNTTSTNGYLIGINANGNYGVWKMTNGVTSVIRSWTAHPAIYTGLNATNIITIQATGNLIKVYANATLMYQFTDNSYASGKISLTAYDSGEGYNRVLWDNFRVTPTANVVRSVDVINPDFGQIVPGNQTNPEYCDYVNPNPNIVDQTNPVSTITYNIYRNADLENLVPYATGITTNSYIDPELYEGDDFIYYVSAVYTLGASITESVLSNPAYMGNPLAVENLTATVNNYNVTLNWNHPGLRTDRDATSYRIYRGATLLTTQSATLPPTYTQYNVAPGDYVYSIISVYPSGLSDPAIVPVTVHNIQPFRNLSASVDAQEVHLRFTLPVGTPTPTPIGANIYRNGILITTGPGIFAATESAIEYIHYYDDPVPYSGTAYTYWIDAIYPNGSSRSILNNVWVEETLAVTNLQASVTQYAVTLTWDLPSARNDRTMNTYSIYRNGNLLATQSVNSPRTYTQTNVIPNVYTYSVVVNYSSGNSDPASVTATVYNIQPVQNLDARVDPLVDDNDVIITWDPLTELPLFDPPVFNIYRNNVLIATGPVTTLPGIVFDDGEYVYIDEEVPYSTTTYTYRVDVVYPNGTASASVEDIWVENILPVLNLQASVTQYDVTLTWDAPSARNGRSMNNYTIYRDGSLLATQAVSEPRTYTQEDVDPGVYTYSVEVNYSDHDSESEEAVVTVYNIQPVQNLTTRVIDNEVIINWDPLTELPLFDPPVFKLYRDGVLISTGPVTSPPGIILVPHDGDFEYLFVDEDLAYSLTPYTYRVDVVYPNGIASTTSSAVYVDEPLPVTGLTVEYVRGQNVRLTWTNPSNAHRALGYVVCRRTLAPYNLYLTMLPEFYDGEIHPMPNDSTGYINLDVPYDTNPYYYHVVPIYSNGVGVPTTSSAVYVDEPLPVTNFNAVVDDLEVDLSWTLPANPRVTGYHIYRTTPDLRAAVKISEIEDPATVTYTDTNLNDDEDPILGHRYYSIIAVYANYQDPYYADYLATGNVNLTTSSSVEVIDYYPPVENLRANLWYELIVETWRQDVVLQWDMPLFPDENIVPETFTISRMNLDDEVPAYAVIQAALPVTSGPAFIYIDVDRPLGNFRYKIKVNYNPPYPGIVVDRSTEIVDIEVIELFPAPTNLMITAVPSDDTHYNASLTWNAPVELPADSEYPRVNYEIFRSSLFARERATLIGYAGANDTSFVDANLPGHEPGYNYSVYAVYTNNRRATPLSGDLVYTPPVRNLVGMQAMYMTVLLFDNPQYTSPSAIEIYRRPSGQGEYQLANAVEIAFPSDKSRDVQFLFPLRDHIYMSTDSLAFGAYDYRVRALYVIDSDTVYADQEVTVNLDEYPRVNFLTHHFNGSNVNLEWWDPFYHGNMPGFNYDFPFVFPNLTLFGFNVYRKTLPDGEFVLMNPDEIIPVVAPGVDFHDLYSYEFIDNNVSAGDYVYAVEAIYTDHTSARVEEPVSKSSHYKTVWDGQNGFSHMNIYVSEVFVDGGILTPGSEIAVFDMGGVPPNKNARKGSKDRFTDYLCVGAITVDTNTQLFDPYLHIPCSMDDPFTTAIDGYTTSGAIGFKIFRDGVEYDQLAVIYLQGNGYFVDMNEDYFPGINPALVKITDFNVNQTLSLTQGWNIVSSRIDLDALTIPQVFTGLREQGILSRVLDEEGNSYFQNTPTTWQNDIGSWSNDEGYRVKVTQTIPYSLEGNSVFFNPTADLLNPLDFQEPELVKTLAEGWQIIPNPYKTAFPAFQMVEGHRSLFGAPDLLVEVSEGVYSGVVKKILSQNGQSIEILADGTLIDNIVNFQPGQGYLLFAQGVDLVTPEAITFAVAPYIDRNNIIDNEAIEPVHFVKNWTGNGWQHFNIHIPVDGLIENSLNVGDEIALFDGEQCVGISVFAEGQNYISIAASMAEDQDENINGYIPGHQYSIRIWFNQSNTEVNVAGFDVMQGNLFYMPNETAVIRVNSLGGIVNPQIFKTAINSIYPNPFNPSTNIKFSTSKPGIVKVEIYNIKGQKVNTLASGHFEAGHHTVTWQGVDHYGSKVSSGIYFARLITADKKITRKMMMIK